MQSVSRFAKTIRPLVAARSAPVRHFSPPAATGPFIANPKTVSVVGIPLSLGQPLLGVDQGPNALRNAGLVHRITDLGYRVKNVGDLNLQTIMTNSTGLNDHPLAKHSNAVGKANSLSANAVFAEAEQGRFVLALGGDHSMAIGSISGILKQRPNTGVIWVDAHADINTPESSFSKNIHGMAVSFLMKLHDPTVINGFEWMKDFPKLGTNQIVYLGLRDVDAPERSILKKHGIKAFSMHEIDKYGIGKVMEMALDHLNKDGQRPLHLSVDIDSCDPFLAPSTGTKVRGGLSFREANFICESIAETGALGSMDMVEVNPMINDSPSPAKDETVSTALDMIASALGSSIL